MNTDQVKITYDNITQTLCTVAADQEQDLCVRLMFLEQVRDAASALLDTMKTSQEPNGQGHVRPCSEAEGA